MSYFTENRDEVLRNLYPDRRVSLRVVADEVARAEFDGKRVCLNYLSARAINGLNLAPRNRPRRHGTRRVRFAASVNVDYLHEEARRRGMSLNGLVSRVVEMVARDRLVNSVLDDDFEVVP